MSEKIIKLTQEEISSLSELNDRYAKLYTEIGQNTIKKEYYKKLVKDLTEEENSLLSDFNTLEGQQEVLAKELTSKYGPGSIDLTEGTIVVNMP
jgi:hypothetical protein